MRYYDYGMGLASYGIVQVGHYLFPGWFNGQNWFLYYKSIVGYF